MARCSTASLKVLLIAVVMSVAAACSSDEPGPELTQIRAQVEAFMGEEDVDLSCPSDVDDLDEAVCTVEHQGQAIQVLVTRTPDGALSVEVLAQVVDIADLEAIVREQTEDVLGLPVTAECGDGPTVVIGDESTVFCAISTDDASGTAEVALNASAEPEVVEIRPDE